MASRTWIAVALACFIWFVYERWFAPVAPPVVEGTAPVTGAATQSGANGTAQQPVPATATAGSASSTIPSLFAKVPPTGSVATLDAGKLQVHFSAAGGRISEVAVDGYHETIDPKSKLVTPLSGAANPFSIATLFTDPSLESFGHEAYTHQTQGQGLRFERSNSGVKVVKDFQIAEHPYRLRNQITLTFPPDAKADWGYLVIPVGATAPSFDGNDPLRYWEVVSYQNDSIKRKTVESLDDGDAIQQGNTGWLAFGNRYFATALINKAELNPDVAFAKSAAFSGGYLRYPLKLKPGQRELTLNLEVFVGPKDYTELSRTPGLHKLIDYGTFAWLAFPLLELLRFFHRFFQNYGIAIILLTLLVRLAFYPLSLKSYRSMKGMSKLQPQIAALKERYKEDPQKFNQEQMALMKAHKVNPMGGCLPMLVQLPVFFALYAMLGNSLEFFHAPFYGWIKDMSAKDPYYVLPVLMGISMFLQQKMTPTSGMDPAQQKILYLMPIVFTFVMLSLPSGLTLYIFVSTLLGILQQVHMNREKTGAPQLAPATADRPGK